jgi:uncharacterized protein YacL
VFVEVTRLFVAVLCTAAGFWLGRDIAPSDPGTLAGIGGMLGCLVGYLGGGVLGRGMKRGVGVVERQVDRLPAAQVMAGLFGGGLGAVLGLTLTAPLLFYVRPEIAMPLGGLVVWTAIYVGFRIAAHRSDDLFAMAGLSTRPLVRATPYDRADGFLVDTSAVMDGQLLPLSRSGLFRDDLLVPKFVLEEMQGMADAGDERGRRARRGLEMLEALRREAPLRVYVLDDEVPEIHEIDAKLVALARRLQIRLLTNDVNLSKVAELQGVPTVSLRRLAADLVPGVLAGESLVVELTRPGRHPGQGVGFLEDGSMVVVNGGVDLVDAGPVSLVATSIVPTSAGRIVFARLHDDTHTTRAASGGSQASNAATASPSAPQPAPATEEVGTDAP